ncbi:hypothetical protein DFH09DRAFT_1216383 [Mycena vulgaris]|nr:hypothetical protein DFH09DRAFT_1216383 [Mycena vulgaris]
MRSFTVILSFISAALAAPAVLTPKATTVGMAVVCTDINFGGRCVEFVSGPLHVDLAGCANMDPTFQKSISSAHGVTDGYTCFLYPEQNCKGTRLVVSGQIPDFRAPSVNFNDKAQSWACGSVV